MFEAATSVRQQLSWRPLGVRLREAIASGKPPVAVIVEPNAASLERWGLPDHPIGLENYTHTLANACADLVCLAKIQPAAFERFGPDGMASLAKCVTFLQAAGIAVLLDTKRGDHAPVLRQLIDTYVGVSSLYGTEGMSLLPYLGLGEIFPVAGGCADAGGLLAVVIQTSNAGAATVQGAAAEGGQRVARVLSQEVSAHNVAAGRDEVAVVLGGPPPLAADLLEGHRGLAILPGWGRAGVDRDALRSVRSRCPEQVLISMGSHLTHRGPEMRRLRDTLEEEITLILA